MKNTPNLKRKVLIRTYRLATVKLDDERSTPVENQAKF